MWVEGLQKRTMFCDDTIDRLLSLVLYFRSVDEVVGKEHEKELYRKKMLEEWKPMKQEVEIAKREGEWELNDEQQSDKWSPSVPLCMFDIQGIQKQR